MTVSEMERTEREVLEVLRRSHRRPNPKALVEQVKRKKGLSDSAVREAIWRLIDRMELVLTPDRKLTQRRVRRD